MNRTYCSIILLGIFGLFGDVAARAEQPDVTASLPFEPAEVVESLEFTSVEVLPVVVPAPVDSFPPLAPVELPAALRKYKHSPVSLYKLPYSLTYRDPQWHRLWINTAVLSGAFVGTLLVLECLPEDATTWNRAEIRNVNPFKRWYRNIFVRNPEWDHDNFVFNYVLHPYAGAAYFMAARSCGFNFYQSLLYSFCISTVGWEFGIEAFMERPSYQDLFITPVVGSLVGELFYKAKRSIVGRGYVVGGSRFLGHTLAFLVDPVNEFIDIFRGSPERTYAKEIREAKKAHQVESALMPAMVEGAPGFSFVCRF